MSKKLSRKSERISKTADRPSEPILPRIARPKVWSLASFVRDDCGEYATFLAYVKAGATPAAAAACVGLSEGTWREWFARSQGEDKHPLIRRFGNDLLGAIGQASVVAEVNVAKVAPREYLKGPARRMINNDWETPKELDAVPAGPTHVTNNTLVIAPQVQQDALKALEDAGIITVRSSPRTSEGE